MIIKVSDFFCEWEYDIKGLEEYSIREVIDIITCATNSSIVSDECINSFFKEGNTNEF